MVSVDVNTMFTYLPGDRYTISLFPLLHTPSIPLLPVSNKPMVSVDVKHHVYLLTF